MKGSRAASVGAYTSLAGVAPSRVWLVCMALAGAVSLASTANAQSCPARFGIGRFGITTFNSSVETCDAVKVAVRQAPSTVISGVAFVASVELRDEFGTRVRVSGRMVTSAVSGGTHTLGGTTSATTNADGVAIFAGLTLTGTSGPASVRFGSTGLAASTQTLTVSQPTYSVSPVSWTAPASGGSQSIAIATAAPSASWTATSGALWLTVSAGSGSGSGTVTLTAAANLNPTARTATATIAGQTVSVSQQAAPDRPVNLTVQSIDGNSVTLRWQWLAATPDSYVLKGGVEPGQTIAALPTGSNAPTFTFTAPTGAFYVRIAGVRGGVELPVSDDVRIYVNVPQAPSAPKSLLGLANGSALELSWENTAGGGAPTGNVLDVSGPLSASLPLPLGERFSYPAVPAGTYTFSVRSTNADGTSTASAPVTLTFPGTCAAPSAPAGFQAYAVGSQLFLRWDSPASGAAVTGYVLTVSGAFNLSLPLTSRDITSPVPPGSYTFTVASTNPCGTSAATAAQTVVVP